MARTKTKLTQSEKVNSTNATVFFEDNSLPSSKLKDFKADGNVTWSSDLHIPSAKAIFTWAGSLFVKLANKITSWSAIPSNDNVPSEKLVKDSLDAKVTGAASSTDNAIPRFDGATGKIIQNSAVFIDDNSRVHFSDKAVNGMLVWPAIYDAGNAIRKTRNMFMNSGDLLVNAIERGMTISANRNPVNGVLTLPNVFKNTGAGVKPYWSNVSPANPVIITIENIPNVAAYKMLLVPGGRNSMPIDYSLELWSIEPVWGVNGYAKLVDVTGDTTTYLKVLDTYSWSGVYKIVLTVTNSGDADYSGYFELYNIILYERYIGKGRFTGYNMSACGDTVYGDYRFHGKVGINTDTPTYKLDVRGTAATDGIRSCIGLDIYPVPNPIAPTLIKMTSGGLVDVGDHYYSCTYVTDLGETNKGGSIKITVTSPNQTVVIGVPISSDPRVTARRIFRTKSGDASSNEYLLAVINDNTTSEYIDNIADSALTGSVRPVHTRMNTTSNQITLNGVRALFIDIRNTIIGLAAGSNLTTGGSNFLAGNSAGSALTTGSQNVVIGNYALIAARTTSNCVGVGNNALLYCTGDSNVGIGSTALSSITTAIHVVGLGTGAGRYIADGVTGYQTGSYGVYIGTNTKALSDGTGNEVVIGYNAVGHGSNTVTLGHTNITKTVLRGDIETNSAKYQYIAASTSADTVNDLRVSNSTGSLKIEKCTVASAIKGSGTWTEIRIGDVIGPSGATADGIALFNSTGKSIKDSGKKLSDYQTVVSEVAISSGNTYVISNNTEYRAAAAITTITFTAPASGNYECYVRFTTASTGTISVSFPNGIKGNPVIGNSETWEFSCKDGYTLAIQLS